MSIDNASDSDLQDFGQALGGEFRDRDIVALAALTPEQRAVQAKLRRELWLHIDSVWEGQERTGVHPVEAGGFGAVAGLRDLLDALCVHVEDAQYAAGDAEGGWLVRVTAEAVE